MKMNAAGLSKNVGRHLPSFMVSHLRTLSLK